MFLLLGDQLCAMKKTGTTGGGASHFSVQPVEAGASSVGAPAAESFHLETVVIQPRPSPILVLGEHPGQ